jgi:DNA-binding MarR family transcriptional regulator
MPRLDAERIALWRELCRVTADVQRRIAAELMDETGVPLAWFEVLAILQQHHGSLRVKEICAELDDVPSSLSRRLDRLEDEGYLERAMTPLPHDRRAVTVTLTAEGRAVWREANVVYRRLVQNEFARTLTDTDLATLHRVLTKLQS